MVAPLRPILTESEQLQLIRCHTAESGYTNVYRSGTGWRAEVKRCGHKWNIPGSFSPHPRDAARHVVRWYASEYGDNWPGIFRARKARRPYQICRSKLFGGYFAVVYIQGERTPIEKLVKMPKRFGRDRWKPIPGQLAVFPTKAMAIANMRLYLTRVYGILREVILRRSSEVEAAYSGERGGVPMGC